MQYNTRSINKNQIESSIYTLTLASDYCGRAVIGSVSDHCAHHARCSVMIVKKPKLKR
ncbi:putative rossmann-like alpha/beta/alpha sandwich protein [Lupinus albus]|uniref:Putative rossmann-like alpha/beta/alpha sandwich protein n=1 Tax=Lupinus albus TaxID=3870 RepID=A0A6A4Q0U7_LUPAL|nr:putative rossmann-like alpha/beta/alpha sandwich protein [Lupinus albus]